MNSQRARRQRLITRLETQRDSWVKRGIVSGEDYLHLCERIEKLKEREANADASRRRSAVHKQSPTRVAGTMRHLWVGGKPDGQPGHSGEGR